MESQSMHVHSGAFDHLRYGFRSLETEKNSLHPVDTLQKSRGFEFDAKMDMVLRTYGTHMALRLISEKEQFSRPRRLPGLPSSTLSLDTVTGSDSRISFVDSLSDPSFKPVAPKIQLHELLEMKLRI